MTAAERKRPLVGNSLWAMIGNVAYALTQWVTLVLIIQYGSVEMAGDYGYALAVTAPVFLLLNLQLRSLLATEQGRDILWAQYLTLRMATSSLGLAICLALSLFPAFHVSSQIIALTAACKLVESLSELYYGNLQRQEQMKAVALSQMMKGVGTLIVTAVLIIRLGDLRIALLGMLVVWLTVFIGYDVRQGAYRFAIDFGAWRRIKPIMALGLPLGFVLMVLSLTENIPRYFIEHHGGVAALGIYSAIAYFKIAGGTLVNAIGQSASQRLAKLYAEGQAVLFRTLIVRLIATAGGIGLAGIAIVLLAGKLILSLFYGPAFEPYEDLFLIVMIASAISYAGSVMGYVMTACRMIKIQPYLYTAVCLVSLAGSYAWIPAHGLKGAAMVLILHAAAQLLLSAAVTYRTLKRKGVFG